MGLNAEEIFERMGTLPFAQIYAALTYYHANREEIEAYLTAEKATDTHLRKHSVLLNLSKLFECTHCRDVPAERLYRISLSCYAAFSGFWFADIQPLVLSLDFKNLAFH
ncbi:MAG: hypothetical protein KME25_10320 [Symplocastrum torsivum CPER-KK1]|jgi:hypothetical protein|uniref:DUF433 domain-containing protein n=1 Tax=Symplocastrum torsivum CPER-KK1 TaxID=450513 RepID=A0A951PJM3_9CYAN|nr:hypothetical protein [Symplocastrum torsivum CPER-KK1]